MSLRFLLNLGRFFNPLLLLFQKFFFLLVFLKSTLYLTLELIYLEIECRDRVLHLRKKSAAWQSQFFEYLFNIWLKPRCVSLCLRVLLFMRLKFILQLHQRLLVLNLNLFLASGFVSLSLFNFTSKLFVYLLVFPRLFLVPFDLPFKVWSHFAEYFLLLLFLLSVWVIALLRLAWFTV